MSKKTKLFTIISLFTAFSVILGYIEFLIPFNIGIYGFKLGLANIATVIALYLFGLKGAIIISFLRILIVNMLFGTLFSLIFSMAAGISSLIIMWLLHRFFKAELKLYRHKVFKANIIFNSSIGGMGHNIVQLLVAFILLEAPQILYMIPILVILGLITGIIVGIVSMVIFNRIKHYVLKMINI